MRGQGPAQGHAPSPAHRLPQSAADVDAAHALPTEAFPAAQAPTPRSAGASTAGAPTEVTTSPTQLKERDLTINKVIAGAGAAATSAVLGSFFGAMGTVGGAAVGSVVSMLTTSFFQHSLDRTADTVKARVKLPSGKTVDVDGPVAVPPPVADGETGQATVYVTPGDQPTEVLPTVPGTDVAPAGSRWSRRRVLVMAGFTVLVFALAMLAVTGIELVKGSPLNSSGTSGGGTSVGRVLTSGDAGTDAPADAGDESATESATETDAPSDEDGADPSADEPRRSPAGANGGDEDAEPSPTPSPGATLEPESGAEGDAPSGGGAAPQTG
jgi:hypothetical protein